MIEFFIGVDGGGSGTRVRLVRADGTPLGEGSAGPSGLMHGIDKAWNSVEEAAAQAFGAAGLPVAPRSAIAIGLGLAGVHNKEWADAFVKANPGYARVALESDGHTTVLGAHAGQPGGIVALGTGSVAEVRERDGTHREVSGWGFPAGDEASGAWMGLRAVNHMQQVMDGRVPGDAFADEIIAACGGHRHAVQVWLANASQTTYAQLARIILKHGPSNPVAQAILREAGRQVELMADALDQTGTLPIALCGGLATPLKPWMPPALLARVVPAQGDSAAGALRLIQHRVKE